MVMIAALLLLALMVASGQVSRAAPAPGKTAAVGRTAELEVIDQDRRGGGARTIRFAIALAEDTRSSHVETNDGQTRYKIQISSRRADGATAMVDLDLRRTTRLTLRGARSATSTTINLSSRVALGRRVELGRIERADGGNLQVALTLR